MLAPKGHLETVTARNPKDDLLAGTVRRVFTPSAPVRENTLFAGRLDQMQRLLYAMHNAGQHAVIYGEPGVGKTSLGKVMVKLLTRPGFVCMYTSCGHADDFSSICRTALSKIEINTEKRSVGFAPQNETSTIAMSDLLPEGPLNQNQVADILEQLTAGGNQVVLFIDEFDRAKPRARKPFAELVKALSDNDHDVTVVFIGVAENVEQLIEAHRSTERNLHQIRMPRMSLDELKEIVDKGLKSVDMTIDPLALERIAVLSRGLPHYTHLVAQHAAVTAVNAGLRHVSLTDAEVGVANAVQHSQHSLVLAYNTAASGGRSEGYRNVLLACALADGDEQGWVTPTAVRKQLRALSLPGESTATRLLSQLCDPSRGGILCETGPSRRHSYRFRNPLMQPYVVMTGIVSGVPVERVVT